VNTNEMIHEEATSFPVPVMSQDTAAEELLVIGDWTAEETPSLDELLELRCCSL
jgi:hypothetical protein